MATDVHASFTPDDPEDHPDDFDDQDIHLVPSEDIIEHESSYNCPCQPERSKHSLLEDCTHMWVHKCLKDLEN